MKSWCVAIGAMGLAAVGCGGSDGGDERQDAAVPQDMHVADAQRDSATTEDNDSFANPLLISDGEDTDGVISPGADTDTYAIDVASPRWLRAIIDANPDREALRLDSLLELYDASMNRIAINDDAALVDGARDSDLITYLPAAGRYYIVVNDYQAWSGGTPRGSGLLTYNLWVQLLTSSRQTFIVDAERSNDATNPTPIAFNGSSLGTLVGTSNADDDVDVFSFSIASAQQALSLNATLTGPDANGATSSPARIWITNEDGSEVVASLSNIDAVGDLMAPTTPGNWLLWIAGGPDRGANPSYVFKYYRSGDNPREAESSHTNDTFETAESLSWSSMGQAFVLATLGEDDVDYFRLPAVPMGHLMSSACSGQTGGSGVLGLKLEIVTSDGNVLGAHDEAITSEYIGARLTGIVAPAAGDYAVRLTKTGQAEGIDGAWVRCGFRVVAPSS